MLPRTKRPNKRAHWFIKNRDGRQDCASITLGCWWLLCAAMRAVRLLLVVTWLVLFALVGASWDTLVRCCAAASAHSDEHASRAAYEQLESDEHMERVRDQVGIARLPFEFVRDALPDSPNARWLQMWKRRLRGNEWMSDMRGRVLVSCSVRLFARCSARGLLAAPRVSCSPATAECLTPVHIPSPHTHR